jgi:hypothetical protein
MSGAIEHLDVSIYREYAEKIVEDPSWAEKGRFSLLTDDNAWTVLGQRIPAGKWLTVGEGLRVDPTSLAALPLLLTDPNRSELPIRFVPRNDTVTMTVHFLQFLPGDEAESLIAAHRLQGESERQEGARD